jgi:hypothetical protein
MLEKNCSESRGRSVGGERERCIFVERRQARCFGKVLLQQVKSLLLVLGPPEV